MEQNDDQLLAALRARDEAAFRHVVREWNASMLRVAQISVPSRSVAEEVVQETWLRALNGLERFEGRSSLKTWVFRILVNTARTRAQREGRVLPFSALQSPGSVPEAAVDPDRFRPEDDARYPGHWTSPPRELPEERLLAAETRQQVAAAIDALPPSQAAVIRLRDVDGWSAEEVCNALEITEVNQRVLLHRARSRVRKALEDYLAGGEG